MLEELDPINSTIFRSQNNPIFNFNSPQKRTDNQPAITLDMSVIQGSVDD